MEELRHTERTIDHAQKNIVTDVRAEDEVQNNAAAMEREAWKANMVEWV
jgi:hypothetical protein